MKQPLGHLRLPGGHKPTKRLVLTVVTSAGLIGLTLWGLAYLLKHADANWVAAIQLFSTLALLGVTSLYVYLTYRLLYIQERPLRAIRLTAQEQAVREVTELVSISYHAVGSIADLFPLDLSKDPTTDYLDRDDDYISTASALPDALIRKVGSLPAEFRPPAADAMVAVLRATATFFVLKTCIYKEHLRIAKREDAGAEAGNETTLAASWEGGSRGLLLRRARFIGRKTGVGRSH